MSLTKTASQAMQYEAASKPSKPNGKTMALKVAGQVGTASLLWLLVKRHKVGLLAIGNIVLLLNWAFPEWPQIVLGLVGK
jgi:hypothetical protein